MTAVEKADELIDKMYYNCRYDDLEDYIPAMAWERAKQCALIVVDEIYQTNLIFGRYEYEENPEFFYSYWEEVKTEIEKL